MYMYNLDFSRQGFKVVTMNDYSQRTTEDLSYTKGDTLTVLDTSDSDWWFARNQQG